MSKKSIAQVQGQKSLFSFFNKSDAAAAPASTTPANGKPSANSKTSSSSSSTSASASKTPSSITESASHSSNAVKSKPEKKIENVDADADAMVLDDAAKEVFKNDY